MHVTSNLGGLNVAEDLIERALSLEPYNRAIKHSLAEVDLRRSRLAVDFIERQAWRRSAVDRASALTTGNSPYPHHTLLKAAIDAVRDALVAAETEGSDAATLRLGEAIANAELFYEEACRHFPMKPFSSPRKANFRKFSPRQCERRVPSKGLLQRTHEVRS